MRGKRFRIGLLAMLLALITLFSALPLSSGYAASSVTVRVKLSTTAATSFTLKLKGNYTLAEDGDAVLSAGSYKVSLSGGKLTVKNDSYSFTASTLSLSRKGYTDRDSHSITMNNIKVGSSSSSYTYSYLGDMVYSVSSGAIRAINHVDLEEYLYGVVGYEMSNSFPLEALKAQAVCARGYAVKSMDSSASYDLNDTSSNQVYRGYKAGWTNVLKAVDETRGMVLKYDGKICTTYFAASNGGQTELAGNAWSSNLPYLVQKDDKYDLENPSSLEQIIFVPADTSAEASEASGEVVRICNVNTACNVRSGPGTGYDKLGTAALGNYYTYLGQEGEWYKIDYNGKEAYVIDDYAEKLTLAGGYTYENLVLSDLQQQAYKALAGSDIALDGKSSVKIVKIKSFKNGKQRWNTATSRSYVTADATLVVQYLPAGSSELSEKTTLKVSIDLMIKSGSDYQLSHPYLNSNLRLRGVEETEGGYNVTNRRYGHGVGMSQRGAQTMAKSYGMTYKEILAFYFDGTYLESLYTAADKATLKSSKYTIGKKTVTGVNPSSSTKGFLKNFTVSDGTIALYTAAGKQKTDGDVGTGDVLYLKDSAGDVQAKYTVIIYGDVNGDSEITLVDLLRIQKHLLGTQSITGASATAADVSRDGEITLVDLLRVQKHLLGTSSVSQKEG